MNKNYSKILIIYLLAGFLVWPFSCFAYTGTVKETYPKLANYYLRWDIPNTEVNDLAKWDVVVLDMEVQHNSLANLKKLRQLNPNIIILAYITSEEIYYDKQDSLYGELRNKLLDGIDSSWWLKDKSGSRVSFWSKTNMLNLTDDAGTNSAGERWNDYLPEFVNDKIMSTGLWDGVFFDNLWPDVSWVNSGNLDINDDGKAETKSAIDKAWADGNKKMLAKTQELLGGKYLVVANSRLAEGYQPYLNGIMLESFPSPWENGGTWAGSMKSYTDTKYFKNPYVGIINSNNNNNWAQDNYRKLRFSLGSALLGNASFSFDYGVNDHSQTWWYDEYEVALGKAISAPVNILDKNNKTYKDGLWRRDFENGIVVVNSTAQNQNYVFADEVFDKINGTQDRSVNNGAKINLVSIMGKDAVVLLGDLASRKIPAVAATPSTPAVPATAASSENLVKNSAFKNGSFVRVFNPRGDQMQNGFFAYDQRYPGGAQIIYADLDNDKIYETIVNHKGMITIYRDNKVLKSFQPFAGLFKGDVSLAAADLDGDGNKEIVVGAGAGGGPQVRIFNKDGRLLTGGFFAYDRNFRGGVNVAAIDLNGDGTNEIITGAGSGGGPQVRIFNKDGKVLGGFFAYDKNARNGVTLSVGNVNGGSDREIITVAQAQIRIWNRSGKLISQFIAYDQKNASNIMLSASDINNDGADEILAGNLNY
jgi:hypothetical protein